MALRAPNARAPLRFAVANRTAVAGHKQIVAESSTQHPPTMRSSAPGEDRPLVLI
jgi:hypothetical protein